MVHSPWRLSGSSGGTVALPPSDLRLPRPRLFSLPDEGQVVAVVVAEGAGDGVLVLGVVGHVASRPADLVAVVRAGEGEEDLGRLGPDLVHPPVDLALLSAELVGGAE